MPQNETPRIIPDTPENGKTLRAIREGSWNFTFTDSSPSVGSEMKKVESQLGTVLPEVITEDNKLDIREAVYIVERANPKTHPHADDQEFTEKQVKAYALGQQFLRDNGVTQDKLGVYHDAKNNNQEIIVPGVKKSQSRDDNLPPR